jgi:TonB family protein
LSPELAVGILKSVGENRMFSSLPGNFNSKQLLTFTASLWLQVSVLVVVVSLPPQMSGPSIHHESAHAAFTPIYFHHDVPAAASIPDAAPATASPAPQKPNQASDDLETASNAQPDDNASGESDGQGLVPFADWSINSQPRGFTVMHHQFKTALAVFTPDPPILRKGVPESARGKDVVLEVVIDDQGSIVQAKVLQGIGYGVEMSIMETLRQWIFVPAKVNGVAIASRRQLRFHFPA